MVTVNLDPLGAVSLTADVTVQGDKSYTATALRVNGQALARVGEARAPRGPVEQRGARLLLKHRELLRDRARGVAQGFGGPRDRAPRGELVQHAKPADIKH